MATEELKGRLLRPSRRGDLVEVETILDTCGNDFIETRNENGCTSLMLASLWGYIEIVKILLKKGASRYGGPACGASLRILMQFAKLDIRV